MAQLHKRFSPDQLKELFERYLQNEIERKYIQEILGIKKSRFFMLLKANLLDHPLKGTCQEKKVIHG
jgi:hypothetical protein